MNLASIIDGHPADAPALISQGRITTYGSLRERTDSFRSALEVLGVEAGDRVALLCGNDTYFAVALLATVGLGAVAVPLNPTSPAPELERQLAEVTPVAAVVGPMASAAWQAIHPSVTGAIGVVVATPGHDLDGAHTFDQLLDATPLRPADVSADTLALLMFTSGTAGSSLAAMLTHGNLLANLGQIRSGGEDRLVPVGRGVRRAAPQPHHGAHRGAAADAWTSGRARCWCSGSTRSPRWTPFVTAG